MHAVALNEKALIPTVLKQNRNSTRLTALHLKIN